MSYFMQDPWAGYEDGYSRGYDEGLKDAGYKTWREIQKYELISRYGYWYGSYFRRYLLGIIWSFIVGFVFAGIVFFIGNPQKEGIITVLWPGSLIVGLLIGLVLASAAMRLHHLVPKALKGKVQTDPKNVKEALAVAWKSIIWLIYMVSFTATSSLIFFLISLLILLVK